VLLGWLLLLLAWCACCWAAGAAQSVTLAWNPNTETNLAGYRLYYGTASRQYAASNSVPRALTTSTVTNLTSGATYYFAVTAVSLDGLESGYSDEVSYRVPAPPVLAAPLLTENVIMPAAPAPVSTPAVPLEMENVVVFDENFPLLNVAGSGRQTGPALTIVPLGQPVFAFRLEFDAPVDKVCEIEWSEDFSAWSGMGVFPTGSLPQRMESYVFPGPADSRRFYRLAVW
jgi:hypothetical protein